MPTSPMQTTLANDRFMETCCSCSTVPAALQRAARRPFSGSCSTSVDKLLHEHPLCHPLAVVVYTATDQACPHKLQNTPVSPGAKPRSAASFASKIKRSRVLLTVPLIQRNASGHLLEASNVRLKASPANWTVHTATDERPSIFRAPPKNCSRCLHSRNVQSVFGVDRLPAATLGTLREHEEGKRRCFS